MALSASTVIEVENGGAATNGGGFVTGASGTDFSQQAAAQFALTNGVTNGTTTIATVSAVATMIGNLVYVAGGTGSLTGVWKQITAQSTGVSITVDSSTGLGASTGVTLNIGGALDSLGTAGLLTLVGGNTIYIKQASTYSISSATNNVSGGCFSVAAAIMIIGYTSNRTLTNTDTRPTLQFTVGSATLFAATGSQVSNLIIDGNSQASSKYGSAANGYYRCHFINFSTSPTGASAMLSCSATTNSAIPFAGSLCYGCEAFANTATGFTNCQTVRCLSYGNTGVSTDGFNTVGNFSAYECISYGNGRHGFVAASTNTNQFVNCIAEANTGFGFSITTANFNKLFINCATFNNTSGAFSSATRVSIGDITGSSSFFVNAASSNFALNNTANAGALLRATGYPATFPAGLTANYQDVGAAQHQDSGSSGMLFIPNMEGT